MPLSKKRMRERKPIVTLVKPITLDNATFDRFIDACEKPCKPNKALVDAIPNCPDGRYRATK